MEPFSRQLPIFLLVHSPLVGPFTWALAARALSKLGFSALTPELTSPLGLSGQYWLRHAREAARSLAGAPADQPVLLVAHSGAGPLLPAIQQAVAQPVAGALFVDAGWPVDGMSRLEVFENQAAAEEFRASARGGLLPAWTEADLREVIPDDTVRGRFAAELRPLPVAVYEEPLPVYAGWPDAPVGMLRFGQNPAYDWSERQAAAGGWPVRRMTGMHFHMLVDPEDTVQHLLQMARELKLIP